MREILANHLSNKGLISKILRKCLQLINWKNKKTQLGKGPEQIFTQRRLIANRHMKKCYTTLIICEMQMKTAMTLSPHTLGWPLSMTKKRQVLVWVWRERNTYWWKFKLVQVLWKIVQTFPKNWKIELTYDTAIPLLLMYPEEMKSVFWRYICTRMFISALFKIAKIRQQLVCFDRE